MSVQKSKHNDQYAITCDVIAYHLVHFVSIWVINKCQSGVDFFLLATQYNSSFMNKISVPSPVFAEKYNDESETAKCTGANVNNGMRFALGTLSASLIL